MGVHPYFRRNGIGFKMLKAVTEEGKKQGAEVAHAAIQANNLKSIMLYKKIGFFMDRREVALMDLNDLNKKKTG